MAARTGAKPEEYYVAVLGMGGVGKSSFITQVLFQLIYHQARYSGVELITVTVLFKIGYGD